MRLILETWRYTKTHICQPDDENHYNDVIMDPMVSLITSVSIVYSTVCSGANQLKHHCSAYWPLWGEFTGYRWIPRTKASYAENVSIWWRHHPIQDKGHLRRFLYWACMVSHSEREILLWFLMLTYRKIYNIRRTNSPNVNVSRLHLQLSLPNPMKPSVKSRMKM